METRCSRPTAGRRRGKLTPRPLGLLLGLVLTLGVGGAPSSLAQSGASPADGALLDVTRTEQLVRAVYYEGMPVEEAERIGPEGCARLAEMLEDEAERRHHGRVLMALGICGGPDSFEAIRRWADAPRVGEVDRATFRAWQVLPHALARLAERDPRAFARLEAQLNDASAPGWSFRHHRGPRLLRQRRRAAATALGLSGLPEAAAALERADRRSSDADFAEHLRSARALHRQAREVRERALRRGARGGAGR